MDSCCKLRVFDFVLIACTVASEPLDSSGEQIRGARRNEHAMDASFPSTPAPRPLCLRALKADAAETKSIFLREGIAFSSS